MDFEQNKVSQDDLENVSGGTIVETKDGKFVILPSGVKFYDKKEDAEKAEKDYWNMHLAVEYGCPRPRDDFYKIPRKKVIEDLQTTEKNNSDKINQ